MTRSSHVRSEQREFYEKWISSKRPWVRTSLTCLKYRQRLVCIKYRSGESSGKRSEKWACARSWRFHKFRLGAWILSEVLSHWRVVSRGEDNVLYIF